MPNGVGTRAEARYAITAEDKTKRAFDSVRSRVEGTSKALRRIGTAAVAAAGAAGLGRLITRTVEAGDKLDKMAKRTGSSVEALQAVGFAARRSGSTLEAVSDVMIRMQRRAAAAAQGTGEYAKAFQQLGIDVNHFLGLPVELQLETMADALAATATQGDKINLAMATMGDRAVDIFPLFEDGSVTIRNLRAESEELGKGFDELTTFQMAELSDSWLNLSTAVGRLVDRLIIDFSPALTRLINELTNLITGTSGRLSSFIRETFFSIRVWIDDLVRDIQEAWRWVREFASDAAEFFSFRGFDGFDGFGGFATGGVVPRTGPYMLHAGERVVSSSQTFGDIHIHAAGGLPGSPSQTRAWVRNVLMPEIQAAQRV